MGPCGHTAKEKGILVKVYVSCLANEIPAELAFSTHGSKNDENTGRGSRNSKLRGEKIHDGQHTSGLNFTGIRCKSDIDESCTMAPGSTWQQWSTARRIRTIRCEVRGQPSWYKILLVDNEDTIREFGDIVNEGGVVSCSNYGETLRCGFGQDPPEETEKWIKEHYRVNYNYQAPSEAAD